MGLLIKGEWSPAWYDTSKSGGHFERTRAGFRNWVTPEGAAGPSGAPGFAAETGRYHLYVSYACPWAHRTLIFRQLKQLQEHISLSVVSPKMPDETGWSFNTEEGSTGDAINQAQYLWQIYKKADPQYSGRTTVPVLWDKKTATIVSNESAEIIRMFNTAFNGLTGNEDDYYPDELRGQIDALNKRIYAEINNGVYRAGFATTQHAYDEAVAILFSALDWVEDILTDNTYLTGERLTEADWRLFTTLVRFDPVYVGHFKCNIRRLADYPAISRYIKTLVGVPAIAQTVRIDHIKTHYYWSHITINPTQIVPTGPVLDWLD